MTFPGFAAMQAAIVFVALLALGCVSNFPKLKKLGRQPNISNLLTPWHFVGRPA